ncbi:MAG: oligoribonuclease [Firmicutes bacterium]|nr:oligoribonuclease [Bacillota bacterium]
MRGKSENKEQPASVYNKDELIAAAEIVFGVKPEVVAAAVKMAGKSEMTKDEAKTAIEKFMKKEVR